MATERYKRAPGLEIRYAGVRFRSRLEARWAGFFDGIGSRWNYEPFDGDRYLSLDHGCVRSVRSDRPTEPEPTPEPTLLTDLTDVRARQTREEETR
jgi:hypothetical protein